MLTLYNLGHAGRWVVPVVVSLAVLAAARWWAARHTAPSGPLITSAVGALGWFVAVFAVPALPLRYGLTFGTQIVSLVAGSVIVVASILRGWDPRRRRALVVVLTAGVLGAATGALVTAEITEVRLLAAAAGFVVAAAIVCALGDRRLRGAGTPTAASQRADRSESR